MLTHSKGVLSVHNTDNKCFAYAIWAALHPATKTHRTRQHHYNEALNDPILSQLEYPVAPSRVPQLQHELKLRIGVYTFEDDEGRLMRPLYVPSHDDALKDYPEIQLLYQQPTPTNPEVLVPHTQSQCTNVWCFQAQWCKVLLY
jgi:hypothetical protein